MHRVFVYGTLRKGFGNHGLLAAAKFICNAVSLSKFKMIASGIPYVSKEPVSNIIGEVYEVTDDELSSLDRLEGHPNWYYREPINLKNIETGEELEAEIYFNDGGKGQLIESGDYTNYLNN